MKLHPTLVLSLRAGGALAAFATAGAILLAATHALTFERIEASTHQRLLRQLNELVPRAEYDNDLAADTLEIAAPALGLPAPATAWRARRGGVPVAVILPVVAPDGYSGPIDLLVGVRADGTLAGVRVVAHKETPGLGDKIDLDHGDWILGFAGRSLAAPAPARWAVRKDGGNFDQFTGATITPRAVVKAVRGALEYFQVHQQELFADRPPP